MATNKETKESYAIDGSEMVITRDGKGNVVSLVFEHSETEKTVTLNEDELMSFLRLMIGLRIELKRGQ